MGLFYPRCITLHFSLLNFTKFLLSQSLNFSCFHWIEALSPVVSVTLSSLITSANLSRVHFVSGGRSSLAKSLMAILSNVSPSGDPWVTPLHISLQPCVKISITNSLNLMFQSHFNPFNSLFVQPAFPQLPNEDAVGECDKSLSRRSYILYPFLLCTTCHFIKEGDQSVQILFAPVNPC